MTSRARLQVHFDCFRAKVAVRKARETEVKVYLLLFHQHLSFYRLEDAIERRPYWSYGDWIWLTALGHEAFLAFFCTQ